MSTQIQDDPNYPFNTTWSTLPYEKRGLILSRLRLRGNFNLVERLYEPDYKGGVFLEGRVDTQCGLDWNKDFDVRKKIVGKKETVTKP